MITKENIEECLKVLDFKKSGAKYVKKYGKAEIKVDLKAEKIIYPEKDGLIVNEKQTCNFSQNENFVVFECICRLLDKGYNPSHLELEPKWKVGHGASGGRADILIKDNSGKSLIIIECKTPGKEHDSAWRNTLAKPTQLFSYAQQVRSTKFICLYSSDLENGAITFRYNLITLIDNDKLLEDIKEAKPESYKEADQVEEIWSAWNTTYRKDYSTKGLFEEDIAPYKPGKSKFSLNDLDTIQSSDIQGKYHEFATILRQHNVSGRENAFDKLVNLFLCKIVDETQNPTELDFYWKGVAYDNHFDLQDRLQKLYKSGMKEFLGEDVTYIDNNAIDDAFKFFKNDPDATRTTIKKYFRQLKFYTNNDFAFIDVHNEKLFYQNAEVLLKIVKMLQDIKLKGNQQHQFLGDMFEGFLDQGVKQSEGQFFTPMPIVKFILSSLPLEHIILNEEQIPKTIDYACGSGHFLNEYANQIKPIIESSKNKDLSLYYSNIDGIEKEYRLSKVAKVSSFMYGQDQIKITHGDGLIELDNIKNETYNFLVANPPYAVKGFLETISQEARDKFELTSCVSQKALSNNNGIEAFFIERTKQLLTSGGVAAIIIPASVLTKGKSKSTSKGENLYVKTREILIRYFDIIAISELGDRTFGKTGTNTVVLFLKKKEADPDSYEHYINRINSWFTGDYSKDDVFKDFHHIESYSTKIDIALCDYKKLMEGELNEEIQKSELISDYISEFNKWGEVKNRKKQKSFKELKPEEKEDELTKRLIEYIVANEKDKILYYILSSLNPVETLIMKSPKSKNDQKSFLGYDWSGAKGKEGIKYIGEIDIKSVENNDVNEDDGEVALEEDDRRVLSNLFNLENILTPLYDPKDLTNSNKINSLIRKNFLGEEVIIPEELSPFIKKAKLNDMLEFTETEFHKFISLSPKKAVEFNTQYDLEKIKILADLNPPKTELKGIKDNDKISFIEMASLNELGFIDNEEIKKYREVKTGSYSYFKKGDLLIAKITPCMENGKCAFTENLSENIGFGSSEYHVIRVTDDRINPYYLFNLLNSAKVREAAESHMTGSSGHRRVPESFYTRMKIPIAPEKIQTKIINFCKKLDKQVVDSFTIIQAETEKILETISSVQNKGKSDRIKNLFDINQTTTDPLKNPDKEYAYVDIASVGKGTGIVNYSKKIKGSLAPSRARRIGQSGEFIISSVRPNLKGFAFLTKVPKDTIFSTGFFILSTKDKNEIRNKFCYYLFMYSSELMDKMIEKMPKGQYPSINKDDIDSFEITYPEKTKQDEIIKLIEASEKKIYTAMEAISTSEMKKQEFINKALK